MKNEPTDRQSQVLRFIQRSIDTQGFAPSIREIATELGIRSTMGVRDHLVALERKGLLTHKAMSARTFVLTDAGRRAIGLPARKAVA